MASNLLKTSKVSRDKAAKIASLISRVALTIAAKENEGLYRQYTIARMKYLQLKLSMINKYKSKAVIAVRQIIKNSGK